MARRALTIVEMLIVVALILAMGAVVFPFVAGRLGPATERASTEQAASAIAMCRLDAMRDGRPIRLVARVGAEGRLELVGLPMHAASSRGQAMDSGLLPGDSIGMPDMERAGGRGESAEREPMPASDSDAQGPAVSDGASSRVYLTFARDIRLTRSPAALDGVAQAVGAGGVFQGSAGGAPERGSEDGPILPPAAMGMPGVRTGVESATDRPVTLGIFLPDGSVLVGDAVYALRDDRAFARWQINQWSGRLSSEPIDASGPDAIGDQTEQPAALVGDMLRRGEFELDRVESPSDGLGGGDVGADREGNGSSGGGP